MTQTRDFTETLALSVRGDKAFAPALLAEAATLFLRGEPGPAKVLLRDVINATVGFERAAVEAELPVKSLHRMLAGHGNPTTRHLSAVFAAMGHLLGIALTARSAPAERQRRSGPRRAKLKGRFASEKRPGNQTMETATELA